MTTKRRATKLTTNWKQEISDFWGVRLLSDTQWEPETFLWTTRCCKTKHDRTVGRPKDFYISPVVQFFCSLMIQHELRYGVLSDKYGLHLDTENLEYYDVHPRWLTQQDKKQLGQLIRKKASDAGFSSIAFYSPSPLMSIPYFEMLHYSGLKIWYTTRLTFPLTLSLRTELMRDRR